MSGAWGLLHVRPSPAAKGWGHARCQLRGPVSAVCRLRLLRPGLGNDAPPALVPVPELHPGVSGSRLWGSTKALPGSTVPCALPSSAVDTESPTPSPRGSPCLSFLTLRGWPRVLFPLSPMCLRAPSPTHSSAGHPHPSTPPSSSFAPREALQVSSSPGKLSHAPFSIGKGMVLCTS